MTGEDTSGSFYLGESLSEPGFPGPPSHRHTRLPDMVYVLDGTLTMLVADDTVEMKPGSFVCVTPGVVHTFSNPIDAPVRFLIFNTARSWSPAADAVGAHAPVGPEGGASSSRNTPSHASCRVMT